MLGEKLLSQRENFHFFMGNSQDALAINGRRICGLTTWSAGISVNALMMTGCKCSRING
jgi:hypothetical protein